MNRAESSAATFVALTILEIVSLRRSFKDRKGTTLDSISFRNRTKRRVSVLGAL